MSVDYRALCNALLPLAERAAADPLSHPILSRARAALALRPEHTPLKWLPLPTAIRHALLRAGYASVEAVQGASDSQLGAVRQIGPHGLRTIRAALAQWSPEPAPLKR